jgi:tRNA (mo5U34)-methyltransferase
MVVDDAPSRDAQPPAEAKRLVDGRPFWYHTMELGPGVVTPGWFDLRPIVDELPWPDVRGKRCLDVGPYDGFLTFELERRGAASVVAADISHPSGWDWPVLERERGSQALAEIAGEDPGGGFRAAAQALGSSAERVECSIYDLSPERVGEFDVVVCGSLLLHLRDPLRALEALRSVCREAFLSSEQVNAALTLLSRRRPLAAFRGGAKVQWWIPNAASHRLMLQAAGFTVERTAGPYSIRLGPGHPSLGRWRPLRQNAAAVALTGSRGVPHAAILATPAR